MSDLAPAGQPVYPAPGSAIPGQPGYVVGKCTHRVAKSEWRAGFRTCERCPYPAVTEPIASADDLPQWAAPASGPEHYLRAQALLADVTSASTGNICVGPELVNTLAAAQVHATLALAAATAVHDYDTDDLTDNAWFEVAGVKPT